MEYLGLFFHAPLQSWGSTSSSSPNSSSPRNTSSVPTKSGVIGLLRSALGVSRGSEEYGLLRDIRLLVRVDRPGKLHRDYAIAQRTHHGFAAGSTKEIPKFYLQDATFLVLVGHEDVVLVEELNKKLREPTWAPFIGRRSCVPALPIYLGRADTDDPRAFLGGTVPVFWGNDRSMLKTVKTYDSVIDHVANNPTVDTFMDDPLSFHPLDRRYGKRQMQVYSYSHENPYQSQVTSIAQYQNIKQAFC